MNNLTLYGNIDIYNYLDLSSYENNYPQIITIKNKKFPSKIIYNVKDEYMDIWFFTPRDILSSEIINILINNNKIKDGKFLELENYTIFNIKISEIKVSFPRIKVYESIFLNLIGGRIEDNQDTTVLLYININDLNNIFINFYGEKYLDVGDLVIILRFNEFINYEIISISRIKNIISDNIIQITNKNTLKNISNINVDNEFYLSKVIIEDNIDPFKVLSNFFSFNVNIRDLIEYYIKIINK